MVGNVDQELNLVAGNVDQELNQILVSDICCRNSIWWLAMLIGNAIW